MSDFLENIRGKFFLITEFVDFIKNNNGYISNRFQKCDLYVN